MTIENETSNTKKTDTSSTNNNQDVGETERIKELIAGTATLGQMVVASTASLMGGLNEIQAKAARDSANLTEQLNTIRVQALTGSQKFSSALEILLTREVKGS